MNKQQNNIIHTQVLVIGAGPGGYTAAFRAADLGKKTVLVEYYEQLGGVCLNVGCIPSKALLHVAHVLEEVKELDQRGISFLPPKIDLSKLRTWVVDKVISKLTQGLKALAAARKIQIVTGHGKFVDTNCVQVINSNGHVVDIIFEHAIIAVGSRAIKLPNLPDDPRIIGSTGALELKDFPEDLLIIGGGIIGMELGTVYSSLGAKVSVVELTKQLIPGADPDLVMAWQKHIQHKFSNIFLNTKVKQIIPHKKHLKVDFVGDHSGTFQFDKILCSVGRRPNSDQIGAENIELKINDRGFILVDQQLRTNISNIFAIGDVVGQPMLAHKAVAEAKIAAEVICGEARYLDHKVIPSVAYTNPEIAWVGLTEEQCKAKNVQYDKGVFPWAASGRALAIGSTGFTKILFNRLNGQVIGAGIVGNGASELIAEIAVAIEMGANANDLGSIIHPHPTLSETIPQAAELFLGISTDLLNPKKKG